MEPLGGGQVPCPCHPLRLDLLDLEVAQEQQPGVVFSGATGHQCGRAVLEHGVGVLGLVDVEHGSRDDALGLLHRVGEGAQRRLRPAEARRHGIEHRADLAKPRAERLTGRTVPGRPLAEPREHCCQGRQPRGRGRQPVGEQPHRAGVAGQRRQPAHHEPPNSERDTPASVSR